VVLWCARGEGATTSVEAREARAFLLSGGPARQGKPDLRIRLLAEL
jgi:hypothetical protein